MNYFLFSSIIESIGISILISYIFLILIIYLMLFFNGSDLNEYVNALFGILPKKELATYFFILLLISIYTFLSMLDSILINTQEKEYKYKNQFIKQSKKPTVINFNLNINKDTTYKEESTRYFPNMDFKNISKKKK